MRPERPIQSGLGLCFLALDESDYFQAIIFVTFYHVFEELDELVLAVNHRSSFEFVGYPCPANTLKVDSCNASTDIFHG